MSKIKILNKYVLLFYFLITSIGVANSQEAVNPDQIKQMQEQLKQAQKEALGYLPLNVEIKLLIDVCKKESKSKEEYSKCIRSVNNFYESQKIKRPDEVSN